MPQEDFYRYHDTDKAYSRKIAEWIQEADEAHAQELDEKRIDMTSLEFLIRNLPAWKRWYLKRNQPKNYFRVTRIIPPGTIENPFFWIQSFQIWIKGKLDQEYRIDAHTFDFWAMQPGWEKHDKTDMTYAILRPQP